MPQAPVAFATNAVPLLLFAAALASTACTAASAPPTKCLDSLEKTPPQRHVFFGGNRLPLRLEASPRLTHRLATEIFRIFLSEVLGYAPVEVIYASPLGATTRLAGLHKDDGIPDAVVNVEVWTPPEHDENYAKECGAISFPGRYGWFIPTTLFNSSSGMGSWKYFKDLNNAQHFELNDEDYKYVKELAMRQSRSMCWSDHCTEWAPEWCRGNNDYTPPCATLLAGHADETSFVKDDIEKLHLHVRVVWLGDMLANATQTLIHRYNEKNIDAHNRSLVVLVGMPDELIAEPSQEFTSISMPPCFPSCNNTIHDGCTKQCNYEMQRLVKMAWFQLNNSAKPAFEALQKLKLNFVELLNEYKTYYDVGQAACAWMQENKSVWQEWNPQGKKNVLYIGGIFPMTNESLTYRGIVKAAEMARYAVNNNDTILADYQLQMLVNDGKCQADAVMKTFIDYIMFNRYGNLVGILGPACSDTVEPLAGITRHFRTVVISYSAEGASFSDRKKYPYFFRTIGENKKYRHVYVHILKEMGWKRVAALTEDGQKYTEYVSLLHDELQSKGAVVYNRKFPRERGPDAMSKYLEDIKLKNFRIIIGDIRDDAARDVMCQAYKMQMTARFGYVWFLPSWLSPDWFNTSRHNNCLNSTDVHSCVNCTTSEMLEAINGHLQLSHAYFAPNKSIMQEGLTIQEWREKYKNICDDSKVPTSDYAGYAYDAVWTYAYALDTLARENQTYLTEIHSDSTTSRFVKLLEATNFHGVSGNIQFLNGGPSRVTTIHVRQWLSNTTSTHVVGTFPPTENDKWCCLNRTNIVWFTEKGDPPEDGTEAPVRCVLASLAELMNDDCEAAIIVANVIGFGLLGLLLIIGFLIVKRRYERKVRQTENYMKSLGIDLLVTSDLDKWEIPRDHVVINRKLGEGAFGTVYGGEAHFPEKGWVAVAVKTLKVGSTTEEKLDFLSEAEVMKRFEHKNIVKLLGVCTKNEPVYTVMEFMLYGDLKTFLLARRHLVNERLTEECDDISSKKLTSMVLDVARALSYLAELKYVHRDVASRNCLVNAARVVKLGDFGMTRPMFENDYYKFNRKGLLPVRWMAPESLELGIFTPASDVWSFGVLMYEVITFGSFPFQGLSNNEVLEYVKAGNTLNVPSGVKPQLEGLILSCWNREYKRRPHASEIVEFLANNPRLIAPCLDAPASAVQTEDGGIRMGIPGPKRRTSALSVNTDIGFPVRSPESSCRLPSLDSDVEFCAALNDSGNGVSHALEPLLGHPSSSASGSSIALGLTKYASLQHNSNDYSIEEDQISGPI